MLKISRKMSLNKLEINLAIWDERNTILVHTFLKISPDDIVPWKKKANRWSNNRICALSSQLSRDYWILFDATTIHFTGKSEQRVINQFVTRSLAVASLPLEIAYISHFKLRTAKLVHFKGHSMKNGFKIHSSLDLATHNGIVAYYS